MYESNKTVLDLHFSLLLVFTRSLFTTDEDRVTPDPIDPDDIEVEINFEPDPTDLVLSSIPGGELFNPRKHRFSEEELKPQPMIKKAKKVFVPEEKKVNTLKLYVKLKCKHFPKYYLNILHNITLEL